ncbi:hypothetical protein RJ640_002601 [Escallonia rubra]|uniref:Pectinesterase catalytic domain-containing protein n=1 Tax=Escallonia rubra TaxID=112253 RepID=A0AA88RAF6_9ASTE|nr:hypothetical protein RJ640_002601 [Escallonia rubra]
MKSLFVTSLLVLCVTVRVASALRSSFNATVAQDTSGGYTRTTQAIAAAPVLPQRRDHTETKPGIYDEQVDVWINKTYIAPIGDDASTTKITCSWPRARGLSEIDDPEKQDCDRGCAEFGEGAPPNVSIKVASSVLRKGNNGFNDDTSTMTVEESGIVPEKFRGKPLSRRSVAAIRAITAQSEADLAVSSWGYQSQLKAVPLMIATAEARTEQWQK